MSSNQSSSRGRKGGSRSTPSARPTADTTATRSSGVYDRDFQQHLTDGGIYPAEYEYPDGGVPPFPDNWEVINQVSNRPRPSLSPSQFSEGRFRAFKRADAHAAKEKQVSENVIPLIAGRIRDARCVAGGIPFGNLDPLTDSTLKPGNPDLYYGARPEQLRRDVRTELSGRIEPSTQSDLPVVPNFFVAAKGPDGSAAVAKRSACYDGVLGARGMHSLQSYGQSEPAYDNNASTVTSIYHNGQLQMYTSHPAQPGGPGTRPEYFMHQIKGYAMTSDSDTFRRGATAFRNLRDWTEDERNAAIARANDVASNVYHTSSTASVVSSSFTTEISSLAAETPSDVDFGSQSQGSFTTYNANTSASGSALQELETSTRELARESYPRAKRSATHQPSGRRKRNAGGRSARDGAIRGTQESERWSWADGEFRCFRGGERASSQTVCPPNVWVYFRDGWPNQGGKQWRRWHPGTNLTEYF